MLQRFPENLRILRERRNISQRELAQHIGCTRSYISHLESGKKKPGAEIIFTLADFFGITADALVRDELKLADE
jgi:transcriptional regulator with XRE-family HTH domain